MGDNIKVAVRLRPLLPSEIQRNAEIHWISEMENKICQIDPASRQAQSSYCFDRVFNGEADNATVFSEMVEPLIDSAMKGFNVTIFAYGQTASGKTYTMIGRQKEFGMIQYAVRHIFNSIENTPGREFLLRVSYIEIYNEQLNDLLAREKKPLKIQELGQANVQILNLTEWEVNSLSSVLECMAQGDRQRRVGATNMNERSSRSHAIFRIIVESRLGGSDDEGVQVSHINLVDLAGSEKTYQANTTGERFREGCAINQSLSTLSLVIKQLSDGEEFANFRDSKLTHLLRTSLGGNALTAIICAVTPSAFDETRSTLNFASRAKKVRNKAEVNEIVSDQAMLKRYLNQIRDLEKKLKDRDTQEQKADATDDIRRILEEKDQKIRELNEKLVVSSLHPSSHEVQIEEQQLREMRRMTWGGYKQDSLPTFGSLSIRGRTSVVRMMPLANLNETAASVADFTFQDETFTDAAKFFNAAAAPKSKAVDVGVNTDAPDCQMLELVPSRENTEDDLRAQLEAANAKIEELEKKAAEHRCHKDVEDKYLEATKANEALALNVEKLKSQLQQLEKEKEDLQLAMNIRLEQHLATEAELRKALEEAWAEKSRREAMDESICLPVMNNRNGGGFSLADELRALEEDVTFSGPAFSRKKRPSSILSETLSQMDASGYPCDTPSEAKIRRLSDVEEKVDVEDANLELERIRQQLASLQTVLEDQERDYDRLVRENAELRQRLESSAIQQSAVEQLVVEKRELLEQIESLRSEKTVLMEQLEASSSRDSGELEKLLEDRNNLLQRNADLDSALENLQSEKQRLLNEIQLLNQTEKQNTELEDEVLELNTRLENLQSQTLTLTTQMEESNTENKRLLNEIETFKQSDGQNSELQNEVEMLRNQLETFQDRISTLINEMEESNTEKNRLLNEIEAFKQNSEPQNEIEMLRNQLEAFQDRIFTLTTDMEESNTEKSRLLHEIELLKQQEGQSSRSNEENEELKSQLEAFQVRISTLTTEIEESTSEKDRLLNEIELLKQNGGQNSRLIEENEELKSQLEAFQVRISVLTAGIEESNTEKNILLNEIELLKQSEGQSSTRNEENEELKNQLEAFQERMSILTAEIEESEVERSRLLNEIELLKQSERECSGLKEENEQLKSQLESLQERISTLANEMEESDIEKERLLNEIELLKQTEGQCNELKEENEELKSQLENLQERISTLANEIEETNTEKDRLLNEIETLRQHDEHNSELQAQIEMLRTQLEDFQDRISILTSEMEESNTEKDRLLNEIEALKQNSELQNEIGMLRNQLEAFQDRISSLSNEMEESNTEKDKLLNKIEALKQTNEQNSELRTQVELLQNQLENLQAQISHLTSEKKELLDEVYNLRTVKEERENQLQTSVDNLENKITELQQERSSYEQTVNNRREKLLQDIQNLETENETLSAQLSSRDEDIQQLNSDKADLEKKLEQLELGLTSLEKQLSLTGTDKDKLLSEVENLRSKELELQKLQQEFGQLKTENEILAEKLREEADLHEQEKLESQLLQEEVDQLKQHTEILEKINAALRTEIEEARTSLLELEQVRQELSNRDKETAAEAEVWKQKASEWDKLEENFQALESRHGKKMGGRLTGFYNCFVALELKLQMAQEQLTMEKAKLKKQITSHDNEVSKYKTELRHLRTVVTSQSNSPTVVIPRKTSQASVTRSATCEVETQTDPVATPGAGASLRLQMESYYADNKRLRTKCDRLLESYEAIKQKLIKYHNLYYEAIGKPEKVYKDADGSPGTKTTDSSPASVGSDFHAKDAEAAEANAPKLAAQTQHESAVTSSRVGPLKKKTQPSEEEIVPPAPPECKTS